MKNKLYLISIIIASLMLTSCNDDGLEEDVNPNVLSPKGFWKSEADILKGLTSVYGSLQGFGWASTFEMYIVMDNYRSDELERLADVPSWLKLSDFTNTSSNSVCSKTWFWYFSGINKANQCIVNIPNVPNVSQDVIDSSVAEAKFLRAYFYFKLVNIYGERLPLFTNLIETKDFYPNQAAEGEILKQIEKDLIEAKAALPQSQAIAGRITKGAATALLGKFYLYQKKFPDAVTQFSDVMTMGYSLSPKFWNNFSGDDENNSESIFEVQFGGDQEGGRREYHYIAAHLGTNSWAYAEAFPSTWLFELMKTDLKADGTYSDRIYGTIAFDDPKTETYYAPIGTFKSRITWKKLNTWNENQSAKWYRSAYNVPIIRYADVLLMFAEAKNEVLGTPDAAVFKAINDVRERANSVPILTTLNKEQVREHIRHVERPCELALEGSRWYDLKRWGIIKTTLKANNKLNSDNFIEGKNELVGIPQSEFVLNPDWVQNSQFGK